MEVKIGVQHTPREIVLESGLSAEEVESAVAEALTGKAQLLSLTDEKGRKVLVWPTGSLTWRSASPAPVGWGSARCSPARSQAVTEAAARWDLPPGRSPFRPVPHDSRAKAVPRRVAFRNPRVGPLTTDLGPDLPERP